MKIILYNPQREDERSIGKLARVYRSNMSIARTPGQVADLSAGHYLVGLERVAEATPLSRWVPGIEGTAGRIAIVTGSMNAGLPEEVLDLCSAIVQIESFDDTGCMDPGHAMAVLLHELYVRVVTNL